jgi:hypothetical protein
MRAWMAAGSALVVVLSTGCRQGETPRPAGPPPPSATSAQAVYQSDDGGFRFVLPASWQGGYRIDAKRGDDARAVEPGADHVVTFLYVPQAAGAPERPLLRIIVLPRDQWTMLSNRSGPPAWSVVSERADQVHLAALPTVNPYDTASPDGRRFARMMLTLGDVKRAFAPRS